jgi:hypothetical protein
VKDKLTSEQWEKMHLANSPDTPLSILKELAEEGDKHVLTVLVSNLSIDESIIEILANSSLNYFVITFLLRHPDTQGHIIEKIWQMKEPTKHHSEILPFFLLHDNTPLDILEQLSINGRECLNLLREFTNKSSEHPYLDKMVFKLFTTYTMYVFEDGFLQKSNPAVSLAKDLLFENDNINVGDWLSWAEGSDTTIITQREVREHLLSYLTDPTKAKQFCAFVDAMYGIDLTGMSEDMVKGILQWD